MKLYHWKQWLRLWQLHKFNKILFWFIHPHEASSLTFLFSFRSTYFDCLLEITYLNGLALSESVQNSKSPLIPLSHSIFPSWLMTASSPSSLTTNSGVFLNNCFSLTAYIFNDQQLQWILFQRQIVTETGN